MSLPLIRNQCCHLASILIAVAIITGRTAANEALKVPRLPDWLAGKAELLPPITSEDLTKLEMAWPKIQSSDVIGSEPPEYWAGLQSIVDLGEKTSLALVWMFAKEAPRLNPSAGIRKSHFLSMVLSKDSISGHWMLPLLRYRIQWMDSLLARGEQGQFEMLIDELGAIQGYMNVRGEESDYQLVMDFIAKLAASNDTARRRLSMLLEPEYDAQARANDKWRKQNRPQPYAYHEMAKLMLTARGGDLTKAAKALAGQIDSLSWAFPQLNQINASRSMTNDSALEFANPAIVASKAKKSPGVATGETISSTLWGIVVVGIVAAMGLACCALKMRK